LTIFLAGGGTEQELVLMISGDADTDCVLELCEDMDISEFVTIARGFVRPMSLPASPSTEERPSSTVTSALNTFQSVKLVQLSAPGSVMREC